MSELRTYWDEYELIEKSGQGRNARAKELEALIHKKQIELKLPPYDFDAREIKKTTNAMSTVSGPPKADSVPLEVNTESTGKYTIEQAKKDIGENKCAMLEWCAKWAEARMVYLAFILDRLNPDNVNVARRGQAMNVAIAEFNRMKLRGEEVP